MHQEFIALHERWRENAELFREHSHEATARTYEVCSEELEAALRRGEDDLLDLQEAAKESGYSSDHLGAVMACGCSRVSCRIRVVPGWEPDQCA